MFFSVITKNLKFSYFKRWDGVRDEKFEYCGSSLKNPIFRRGGGGRFTKYQYTEGNFLKRGWGRLGQFADLRGEFFSGGGGGGLYANAHYVVVLRKSSGK